MLTSYDRFGTFKRTFDPHFTLVTSPIFSSTVLLAVRLAIAVYTTVAIALDLVLYDTVDHDAYKWPAYFTNLTQVALCIYFWLATIQTFSFIRNRETAYFLQGAPRILQLWQVVQQALVVTFPFVVSIAFWTLLSKGAFATKFDTWRNISFHILNSVYALFEIFATNIEPMQWTQLPLMLVFILLYTGYAYAVDALEGFFPYTFLDPSVEHGKALLYIIGIMVLECIIFTVTCYLMARRNRIPQKSKHID